MGAKRESYILKSPLMSKPAHRKMKNEKESCNQQTGRQRFDNIELLSESNKKDGVF